MIRLAAIALLSVLTTTIFVSAIRTDRVRTSFVHRNTKTRSDDAASFWFFTAAWGMISLLGLVGTSALLYYAVSGTGPFASGAFLTFQPREWPLVLLALASIYLIFRDIRGGGKRG